MNTLIAKLQQISIEDYQSEDEYEDEFSSDEENIKKQKYIMEPASIPNFVDIDILKEFVKNDIDGNKEYYDDLKITYRISDSKKAEWILKKAIKGYSITSTLVGDGNTNVDIHVKINNQDGTMTNIGVDASVLTLNGNYTNEKSIMQNFSTGSDLDSLFNNNKGAEAINIFKQKFKNKYQLNTNTNTGIYYLIFICQGKNVYLVCIKLNLENIDDMKFSSFTKSCKNIIVDNFIASDFGNVKLYKSKKRLELRLHKNIINVKNDYCIKVY